MPLSQSAGAAIVYSYAAGSSVYSVANAGATVNVPLYLVETVTAGSSSLLATEDGLFSGGIDVARTVGTASINSDTPNPAFAGPVINTASAGQAALNVNVANNASNGVGATAVSSGISEVLLGTVNVTAAATPTTFTLSAYVNGNGTTGGNTLTFDNFYDLDTTSTSPAYTAAASTSFVVSVASPVPEPASLGLLGIAGTTLFARRRGR